MEVILNQILNELKVLREDVSGLKQGQDVIRIDITELKEGQNRLEAGQKRLQRNLVESLGLYTDKIINHIDHKTEVLNKRVFNVETEIERLSRER